MNKKCVLVTGSSIGLGASIIKKYAIMGYNTIITYNSHKDEAIKLQKEIKDKYNTESLVIKCDISKEEDIEKAKPIMRELKIK